MGCFLGCLGGAKERRRRRKRSPAQSPSGRARATPRLSPKKVSLDGEVVSAAAPLLATLLELRDSTDDMCLTVVKKKVTFDPNVTTYEAAAIPEDDEEEADPAASDQKDEARREEWIMGPECAKSEAFPLNHRYNNCADSDNESEYDDEEEDEEDDEDGEEDEDEIDECAIDDEEDDGLLGIGRGEEEACESLFLLPMSKTKEGSGQEAAVGVTAPEAAAPCPTRDRSQYANRVLNSVENLTQWKEAKSRTATATPKASDKENITMLGQDNRMMDLLSEPAIPAKKKERPVVGSDYSPSTPSKQEVSVDASLSTWLGSSGTPESNSVRSYSPISREDRPILGALTMEDIKMSANSSRRRSRSPSPSPDDMPILGTVGAYWNCSAKGG